MESSSFSGHCYLILLANVQVASAYSKCRCCVLCLFSKDISCTDSYGK